MIEPLSQRLRLVYEAGHGKRVILALTFLLLLPFFISLGPMVLQRFKHGLVPDTWGLVLFGVVFAALMVLIAGQLMHSIRSRVTLDETSFSFVLPVIRRGIPTLRFITREMPYDRVQSVETRSEVYARRLAPVMLTSTRIVTRDGESIVLGAVNQGNPDKAFPFPEIGAEIAARAGIRVRDVGVVRRSATKRVMGIASSAEDNQPLSGGEIDAMKVQHRRWMKAMIVGFGFLVAGGIAVDVMTAPTTTFAEVFANGAGVPKR